jgi:hypothetical protein
MDYFVDFVELTWQVSNSGRTPYIDDNLARSREFARIGLDETP